MKTTLQLAVILSFYLFSNFFELNAQSWNRAGNAGTNPATDFVGTTDNVSLKIKTNNTTRINVTSTGKVAIGSNTPMFKLDVQKGSINTDSCYRIGGNTVLSIKNAAGYVNTYCGQYAGLNDTAYSNTYVGLYSGYINSSGYQNTYLGSNSGTYSTGSSNVFMGFGAGYYCSGDHNTLVGKEAGGNCFGNNNSFFGSEAGLNTTSGSYNTFVGNSAGHSNADGNSNTYVGANSGYYGSYNTFLGLNSGMHNTGNNNVFIGDNSASSNKGGFLNVMIGSSTGDFSTGTAVTLLGAYADAIDSLLGATAIGYNAKVRANQTLALGDSALVSTVIGGSVANAKLQVNANSTTSYPNLLLTETDVSDYARLSFMNRTNNNYWTVAAINSNTQANNRMNFYHNSYGDIMSITANGRVGIGNTVPSYQLQVSTNSAAKPGSSSWTVPSDMRLKNNVNEFTDGMNVIEKLHTISYNYNGEAGMPTNETFVGTYAQELQKIAPYMVKEWTYTDSLNNSKKYLGVDYGAMDFILANAIKEVKKENEVLKDENADLKSRIEKLESIVLAGNTNSTKQQLVSKSDLTINPNPFNENTTLKLFIDKTVNLATIDIYDETGRLIKSDIINERNNVTLNLNAEGFKCGTYTIRLTGDLKILASEKLVIVK